MKFGLEPAIDTLTTQLSSEELNLTFTSKLQGKRVSQELEVFIYNTCSELIQNVIKHSTANYCHIQLDYIDGKIILQILDNGENLNFKEKQNQLGFGLTNIQNRAKSLGGQFQFSLETDKCLAELSLPAHQM